MYNVYVIQNIIEIITKWATLNNLLKIKYYIEFVFILPVDSAVETNVVTRVNKKKGVRRTW